VKFAAKVQVSCVITSKGTASLVIFPPGHSLTGREYLHTLRTQHIPRVQQHFPANDFVWIQVQQRSWGFSWLCVVCTEDVTRYAMGIAVPGQRVGSHREHCRRLDVGSRVWA
jgi:hypothetical protein